MPSQAVSDFEYLTKPVAGFARIQPSILNFCESSYEIRFCQALLDSHPRMSGVLRLSYERDFRPDRIGTTDAAATVE